jgi:iron complex outermembrane receptor protein
LLFLSIAPFSSALDLSEDDELMDEFAFLEEAGVVESAARHKQEIGMAPSAITVITREDIEASGATTVTDVLRIVPGMDVIISTPLFTSLTARVNWNDENNHFLILVDGREINLELLGMPIPEIQPILLDDIERIEVIRGPGSFLYGANALAGVISITTRAVPEKTSGWARLAGGQVGSISAGARASTRLGDWGISIGGGVDSSGMFKDARSLGKRVWKLRSVAEYRWSESRRLLIDAGFCEAEGAVNAGVGLINSVTETRALRVAYETEDIRAQIYWMEVPGSVEMQAPMNLGDLRLAEVMPFEFDNHTFNGEMQWMLPSFYEPLLLIVGGVGRATYANSDQMLDAETYTDISSPDYHKPGITHWEGRVGAFLHSEYSPADWITLNGDLRFDYNTVTDEFLSPRLAVVLRPAQDHFIRVGAARSFRKPAFIETHVHLNVNFPADSPFVGPDQETFREFMIRGLGNPNLENEKLLSFEAGYRGEFLDKRLAVSLDLYYNMYTDRIAIEEHIIMDTNGLPDLDISSFLFENKLRNDRDIVGSELTIRYTPSKNLSVLAAWTYREEIKSDSRETDDGSPKNMLILGARFRTDSGLVGSLYAFTRSEFTAGGIPHPDGMLAGNTADHIDQIVLVLGKIGWRVSLAHDLQIEAGLKLFLPISPFSAPHFRYSEIGTFTNARGEQIGGDVLSRMVTGYLQGSF